MSALLSRDRLHQAPSFISQASLLCPPPCRSFRLLPFRFSLLTPRQSPRPRRASSPTSPQRHQHPVFPPPALPLHPANMPKQRCTFEDCKSVAQRIVGDCTFCQGHYCRNHRLLEDHKCQNLEDVSSCSLPAPSQWWLVGLAEVLPEDVLADLVQKCKREAFEQNAMQLNKERTQVIKTA